MTDTDFKELDLNKQVSEMDEDEARETLVDFMEAHQENRQAYDATVSEFEEQIEDIRADKQEVEEKLGEIHSEYAEKAAEVTNMPADLIEERFSFSEVEQILEEAEAAGEFSESAEEEEEENETLTEFAEREEKGKSEKESTQRTEFRDEARELLSQQGIPTGDD